MISVCQLWNDFRGRENVWQGGHARPSSFASWLHEVQIEMQNELIKALGNNQTVTDNLRSFSKSVQVPVNLASGNGIIAYPKDYRRFSSLRYFSKKENGIGCLCSDIPLMNKDGECHKIEECKELTEEEKAELLTSEELCENGIDIIPNNKWGSVCQHELIGPSLSMPYATQLDKGFKVAPKQIGYVILDYISIPVRPIFNFTEVRHNVTCLSTSTSLNWGEEMIPEIMARLKKRYSAFTRNSEGYSEGEKEREITTS